MRVINHRGVNFYQNAHRFGDNLFLGDIAALIAKPMRVKHVGGDTAGGDAHGFGDKRLVGDNDTLIAKPMRVKRVWGDITAKDAHRIGDSHA